MLLIPDGSPAWHRRTHSRRRPKRRRSLAESRNCARRARPTGSVAAHLPIGRYNAAGPPFRGKSRPEDARQLRAWRWPYHFLPARSAAASSIWSASRFFSLAFCPPAASGAWPRTRPGRYSGPSRCTVWPARRSHRAPDRRSSPQPEARAKPRCCALP